MLMNICCGVEAQTKTNALNKLCKISSTVLMHTCIYMCVNMHMIKVKTLEATCACTFLRKQRILVDAVVILLHQCLRYSIVLFTHADMQVF